MDLRQTSPTQRNERAPAMLLKTASNMSKVDRPHSELLQSNSPPFCQKSFPLRYIIISQSAALLLSIKCNLKKLEVFSTEDLHAVGLQVEAREKRHPSSGHHTENRSCSPDLCFVRVYLFIYLFFCALKSFSQWTQPIMPVLRRKSQTDTLV